MAAVIERWRWMCLVVHVVVLVVVVIVAVFVIQCKMSSLFDEIGVCGAGCGCRICNASICPSSER